MPRFKQIVFSDFVKYYHFLILKLFSLISASWENQENQFSKET